MIDLMFAMNLRNISSGGSQRLSFESAADIILPFCFDNKIQPHAVFRLSAVFPVAGPPGRLYLNIVSKSSNLSRDLLESFVSCRFTSGTRMAFLLEPDLEGRKAVIHIGRQQNAGTEKALDSPSPVMR